MVNAHGPGHRAYAYTTSAGSAARHGSRSRFNARKPVAKDVKVQVDSTRRGLRVEIIGTRIAPRGQDVNNDRKGRGRNRRGTRARPL